MNHPKVTSVIAKYELLLEKQRSKPKQEIEVKKNAKNRKKSYSKKNNILNKLRKIEKGEDDADN